MYRGRSLSASGRISCPDDDTVAQNLRYESRMFIQKFVICSRTFIGGVEGISLAATNELHERKVSLLQIKEIRTVITLTLKTLR